MSFKMTSLLGFAPKGVYNTFLVTKKVVSSYLTISPLPLMWRYIFCCTFPRVTPAGRYPALVLWWVRTFLLKKAVTQPSSVSNKSNLNRLSQYFFLFLSKSFILFKLVSVNFLYKSLGRNLLWKALMINWFLL